MHRESTNHLDVSFIDNIHNTSRTTIISIQSLKFHLFNGKKPRESFNCLCKHFFTQYISIITQLTAHQELQYQTNRTGKKCKQFNSVETDFFRIETHKTPYFRMNGSLQEWRNKM